ncbi:MAG: hypothetical protein AAB620_01925 [Patescibacteria group bacterium]
MRRQNPKHILVVVAEILKELRIPYFITGGMAVLVWGRPRFTADIDIIVELKENDIAKLKMALQKLGQGGYIDAQMMREAMRTQGEFNFIDGESGLKVDFWILKNDEFDCSRLQRRVSQKILGKKIYFASAEDLILSKLNWSKDSLSTRHLEDIDSIFKISGKKIDKMYLKSWALKLDLEKLLYQWIK